MTNVDNNFIYILEEIIQERSEADDSQKSYTRDLMSEKKRHRTCERGRL